jgi:GAG-pre-integrase domain/Pol polyprotein, beta-barrel domain
MFAIGTGSITIAAIGEKSKINILELINVLHVPGMDANLLSVSTIVDKGFDVMISHSKGTTIQQGDKIIANGVRHRGLWRIDTPRGYTAFRSESNVDIATWHRRLGHLREGNMRKALDLIDGIKFDPRETLSICGSCQEGKQTRHPSHISAHRAAERCELVHSDLCGPIDPPATGEEKYLALFIDDKTCMTAIVGLQSKTAVELLSAFKVYQNLVKKQTG